MACYNERGERGIGVKQQTCQSDIDRKVVIMSKVSTKIALLYFSVQTL